MEEHDNSPGRPGSPMLSRPVSESTGPTEPPNDVKEEPKEEVLQEQTYDSLGRINSSLAHRVVVNPSHRKSHEIPLYNLSEVFASDPISFVESVKEAGRLHGAVKLVMPRSYRESVVQSLKIDPSKFSFQRRQFSRKSPEQQVVERLRFYNELLKFHLSNDTATEPVPENPTNDPGKNKIPLFLSKLPMMEKRPVDLFDFFRLVVVNGGYDEVVNQKKWAQICQDLGIPGKITNSSSTSLKSAYAKILYPFELYLGQKKGELAGVKSEEPPQKARKVVLSGTSSEYTRLIRAKASKGVLLNDPHHMLGLSGPEHLQANLYLRWIASLSSVIDDTPTQLQLSRSASLAAFSMNQLLEKDTKFQELLSPANLRPHIDTAEMENLFWENVSLKDHNELLDGSHVENPLSLPLHTHGSGLSRFGDNMINPSQNDSTESILLALDPFNLNNLPILPNSLLGAFNGSDLNSQNLTSTFVKLSMTFGFENWKCEDHYLQKCNYSILGGPKMWYFIPELDFERFEKLKKEVSQENPPFDILALWDVISTDDETLNTEYSCLLHALDRILGSYPEIRAFLNEEFQKLVKAPQQRPLLSGEPLITPKMLDEHGIAYLCTVQNAGEMVFTFPKTYSSSVSFGFGVSEETNFASAIWMDYALEAEQWLQKNGIIPSLLFFKLLINLAAMHESSSGGFAPEIYKKAARKFDVLASRELELRTDVRQKFGKLKEVNVEDRSPADVDFISDDDFAVALPSKLVIASTNTGTQFSISLPNALKYLENGEIQPFLDTSYKLELHLFLTDDRLKQYQRLLTSFSVDFESWMKEYDELLANEEVSLKAFKQIHSKGQRISDALAGSGLKLHLITGQHRQDTTDERNKIFEERLSNLGRFIEDSNDLIEECQAVLSLKHQQRIRGNEELPSELKSSGLQSLVALVNRIPQANFYTAEFDQIYEFRGELENFDRVCRGLLLRSDVSMAELNDIINLGTLFGMKLPGLDFLIRIRERKKWLTTHDTIMEGGDPFVGKKEVFSLDHMIRFRDDGYRFLSSGDTPKMDDIEHFVSDGELYNKRVQQYLQENRKLNYVNLQELDKIIDDMEERAKKRGLERLFVRMESYQQLLDLRAQLKLVEYLQNYGKTVQLLGESRTSLHELKKSGFEFDNAKQLEQDLKMANEWTEQLWAVFEKAETGTKAKKSFDANLLKTSANPDLTKRITMVLNKCLVNFQQEPVDAFERCSMYMFQNDIEPNYDDVPLRYCFCREHEDGVMIECDRCHEWYHMYCVKEKAEIGEDDKYTCPVCKMVLGQLSPDFSGDKISDVLIAEFLQRGRQLKMQPLGELAELQKLHDLVEQTKKEFNTEKEFTYEYFLFCKLFGAPILIAELFEKKFEWLKKEQQRKDEEEKEQESKKEPESPAKPISSEIKLPETTPKQEAAPQQSASLPLQPLNTFSAQRLQNTPKFQNPWTSPPNILNPEFVKNQNKDRPFWLNLPFRQQGTPDQEILDIQRKVQRDFLTVDAQRLHNQTTGFSSLPRFPVSGIQRSEFPSAPPAPPEPKPNLFESANMFLIQNQEKPEQSVPPEKPAEPQIPQPSHENPTS